MLKNRMRIVAGVAVAAGVSLSVVACGSSGGGGGGNSGSDYPSRAISYVIPYDPGGSSDPAGREYARELAKELGGTATVFNRPGADETIGDSSVITAKSDGYTLGLTSATGIIVQPLVTKSLSYHTVSDYTPVAMMLEAPNAILVPKNSPYKSLDDLIAAAKAHPGKIRVGTTGRLTNNSFAIAALNKQAGINLKLVPFTGAAEAVRAALGGKVEAAIPTAAGQLGLVEGGKLRGLAYTGTSSYDKYLPGAVSFKSAGYDIPFSSNYLTIAAPGLPPAVKKKLIAAALKVSKSDAWKSFCDKHGFIPQPLSGSDLDSWIKSTTASSKDAIDLINNQSA